MHPVASFVRSQLREARTAILHAPLEVLLGVVVAVSFSVAVREARGPGEWWLRLAAAAALALPLLLALTALRGRQVITAPVRWAASAAVLGATAAHAVWVFDPGHEAEGWRLVALLAAALCALVLVPAAGAAPDERQRRARTWRFDARLLLRSALALAYAGVLFATLAGAVAAVSSLFELKTPDHLYLDLAGAVFFALAPALLAGGVAALADDTPPAVPPPALRVAGRYLYALVLVVYLLILFAYSARVLLTGELPKNLLSPIVLFAGLFGLLGGFLLDPLVYDDQSRGLGRLIRTFPLLLLLLLPLPLWAVWVRRTQYGWTEFRYLRFALLLALLVLAAWGALRLLRRREPLLHGIPLVLGLAMLLSAVGPWGAPAVSRRNQQQRLGTALREAGLGAALQNRLPAPPDSLQRVRAAGAPKELAQDVYGRLQGSLVYLGSAHGMGAVEKVIPGAGQYASGHEVVAALGIAPGCEAAADHFASAELAPGEPIPDLPAGTLFVVSLVGQRSGGDPGAVPATLDGRRLRLRAAPAGGALVADLGPLMRAVTANAERGCLEGRRRPPPPLRAAEVRVPLRDPAGNPAGVLIVTHISVRERGRGAGEAAGLHAEHVEALAVVQ